jgi:3-oxoacyl-[acyl-carrier protein] reductase
MDLQLAGRRALVLGASRGLGAAIAHSLLREGVMVCAASRNIALIEDWKDSLPEEMRGRVRPAAVDLAQLSSVEQLGRAALEDGPIDILVNNGGGPPGGASTTIETAQWLEHFPPMAAHLFALAQMLLPAMIERRWGRIISIVSSGVDQPIPNLVLSNAIRASIVGWSKTLANEVASQGVTVNVVLPGRIHTDRVDALDRSAAERQGKTIAEVAAASANSIPIGRYGRPEEFADVVAFLASERASYLTGSKIRIDGGMIRSI